MLSLMAKTFYGDSPLLFFPLLALALFMAVFIFITFRTIWADKESFQSAAGLPLADDFTSPKKNGAHDE